MNIDSMKLDIYILMTKQRKLLRFLEEGKRYPRFKKSVENSIEILELMENICNMVEANLVPNLALDEIRKLKQKVESVVTDFKNLDKRIDNLEKELDF